MNDRDAIAQGAEFLTLYQLDLLAQVEQQVRAVHSTMRRIERLKQRGRGELSNDQRAETLDELAGELSSLDVHLLMQHDVARDMQDTINQMKRRVNMLRQHAAAEAREPQQRTGTG